METHLKINHLAPYLPYRLRLFHEEYKAKHILDISIKEGIYYSEMSAVTLTAMVNGNGYLKPILLPLSDLTKEINYGLSTYAFTDLFEIGDCDGCVFEFEHGNIKTIKSLENISKYNSYHDINYLPNAVVNMMYEYHFDVFGLIERGLAIDKNTLNK